MDRFSTYIAVNIMLICGGNQAELSLITKHLLFLLSGVFNFLLIKIKRTFSRSEGGICGEQDRMCFSLPKLNVTQSAGASLRGAK